MRTWLAAFLLCCAVASGAHADDGVAKQLFEEGVAAAAEGHWEAAAKQFEASLWECDKPAARFNLVLAYHELGRPLKLAQHAIAFLASPSQAGREEARTRAAELLVEAKSQLASIDLSGAPPGAVVRIDGGPAPVVDGASSYTLPGHHVVDIQLAAAPAVTSRLLLNRGQVVAWTSLVRDVAAPPRSGVDPSTTANTQLPVLQRQAPLNDSLTLRLLRKRTAWTMGVMGAALAVAATACMWVTVRRADDLADGGIEGTQMPGYYPAATQYWSTLQAVAPLAITSGALMAGALPVGGKIVRRGSLAWSIAALSVGAALLGAGTYWLIREPSSVIEGVSDLNQPSRQAGSLLIAAGLPLTTYGIAFLAQRRRPVHLALRGVSTLRVSW